MSNLEKFNNRKVKASTSVSTSLSSEPATSLFYYESFFIVEDIGFRNQINHLSPKYTITK